MGESQFTGCECEMHAAHPKLHLCSKDWKSEALAMMSYPSWHQNHKKSIKKEADHPISDTEPTQRNTMPKWGSDEVRLVQKAAKRHKTDNLPHAHDEVDSR